MKGWSSVHAGARPETANPLCLRPAATTDSCAWWMHGSRPAQVGRAPWARGCRGAVELRDGHAPARRALQWGRRAVGGAGVRLIMSCLPPQPNQLPTSCTSVGIWPCGPWLAGASLAVPSGHGTATNCLRWHPASEHLLLSASHDPAILLHDLRSPGQPLHRLLGHAPGAR